MLPVLMELVMLMLPEPVEEPESVPVEEAVLEPVVEAELLPLMEEEAEAVSLPLVGVEEPYGFGRLVDGCHFILLRDGKGAGAGTGLGRYDVRLDRLPNLLRL